MFLGEPFDDLGSRSLAGSEPDFCFGSKAAVGEARFTTYQTVLNGCKPLVPRELLAWPAPTTGPLESHAIATAITRS